MQVTVEPPPGPAASGTVEPVTAVQRRVRILAGLALLLLGLWTIRTFLPALGWAVILAIATWPLYARVRRRFPARGHDILWPGLFTLAVALLFLLPLAVAAFQLGKEVRIVAGLVEEARRTGLPAPDWLSRLPAFGAAASAWWSANLADPAAASSLLERLNHGAIGGWGRSLGGEVLHRGVVFAFTILTLFFLYRDGAWLLGEIRRAGERAVGPHGERVGRQMIASVHGTVDGLVLVGLAEGVLIGVAYGVAGVPHPTLFGAATAIGATIPFGAFLVFGSAALVLLTQGAAGAAVGILVFGSVVVFVADHAVRPALIGGATRLPFLWVLLGILGGVETFGLLGLFLGPALMAALHLLWREWVDPAATALEPAAPPAR